MAAWRARRRAQWRGEGRAVRALSEFAKAFAASLIATAVALSIMGLGAAALIGPDVFVVRSMTGERP
jgi:hypothetical protein